MESEDAMLERAHMSSYRWLYKELFKLEGDYWVWCRQPILCWYRDTEQDTATWPIRMVRQYGDVRLEYRLYANRNPFTARDVFSLSRNMVTDWGKRSAMARIFSNVDEWLENYRAVNGKCFVRAHFDEESYWKPGKLNRKEEENQRTLFREHIRAGRSPSVKNMNSLIKVRMVVYNEPLYPQSQLYRFPEWEKSPYYIIPEIPKLNLSCSLRKIFRDAENTARESAGLPHVGEGWISEAQLLNFVSKAFPGEEVVHQGSPPWLGRQRFDIYFPEHNIAIEYQGAQHFEAIEVFGGEGGLKKTKERDAEKRRKCARNGCHLIEVIPDYDESELLSKISKFISREDRDQT